MTQPNAVFEQWSQFLIETAGNVAEINSKFINNAVKVNENLKDIMNAKSVKDAISSQMHWVEKSTENFNDYAGDITKVWTESASKWGDHIATATKEGVKATTGRTKS